MELSLYLLGFSKQRRSVSNALFFDLYSLETLSSIHGACTKWRFTFETAPNNTETIDVPMTIDALL